MDIKIYQRGQCVGILCAEEDGLYRIFRASVPACEGIVRLYFPDGLCLGVFSPEGGALCLQRRLSKRSLPELPAYAVAWCEADGRWEGLRRYTNAGWEEAIAWRTDAPMEFPAAPKKLRAVWVGDKICLCAEKRYQ